MEAQRQISGGRAAWQDSNANSEYQLTLGKLEGL